MFANGVRSISSGFDVRFDGPHDISGRGVRINHDFFFLLYFISVRRYGELLPAIKKLQGEVRGGGGWGMYTSFLRFPWKFNWVMGDLWGGDAGIEGHKTLIFADENPCLRRKTNRSTVWIMRWRLMLMVYKSFDRDTLICVCVCVRKYVTLSVLLIICSTCAWLVFKMWYKCC